MADVPMPRAGSPPAWRAQRGQRQGGAAAALEQAFSSVAVCSKQRSCDLAKRSDASHQSPCVLGIPTSPRLMCSCAPDRERPHSQSFHGAFIHTHHSMYVCSQSFVFTRPKIGHHAPPSQIASVPVRCALCLCLREMDLSSPSDSAPITLNVASAESRDGRGCTEHVTTTTFSDGSLIRRR